MAEREVQHGFCGFTASLVIDGHSPVVFYPREGPFYDPSEGKCHKLESRFLGAKYNFKIPSKFFDKLCQRASIATISRSLFKVGKSTYKSFYNRYCAFRIMDNCRMDYHCHRKSKRIYNDMFFPSFDLLTSINSTFLTVYMLRGSYASLSL